MAWWQTLLISVIPAILVAILTNLFTKYNFKHQFKIQKQKETFDKIFPILRNCVNQNPLQMVDTLSRYKADFYVYGSDKVICLVEKIIQTSFKNFNSEIAEFRKTGKTTINIKSSFENFKCILPYIILLFSQIKLDLTEITISPLNYLNLYYNDLTDENKKVIVNENNKIVDELNLNKKFKIE
ncbi:MAG: hypothetical protein PHO06_03165 [Clostridia bacterium]|nr:hypothetical protein [Clostridia bacterium]